MADNTTINPGTGGDNIATDDIGGVKYCRVKMTLGNDGTNDGDVCSTRPMPAAITPIAFSVDDFDTDTNADAVVTYAAVPSNAHVISGVAWSYKGAPTDGRLYIESDGFLLFDIDITSAGAGFFEFNPPQYGISGENFVVTLAAGGTGVVGKINIKGHTLLPD